ncbi:MAG: hypothetical protein KAR06_04795 [Deltaproteobacteria bacterium]|nr:hypothetical protein [Deltaproteobacteria bacterium]
MSHNGIDIPRLKEQLKTILHLVEISLLIADGQNEHLLPSILEVIHLESQNMLESQCIVDMPENKGAQIEWT